MLGLQEQYSPWDLPSRWFLVFLVGNPLLLGIYIKGIVFICFGFLEQIRVNPSFKESINVVLHRLFSYVIGIHIYQWQSMPSACFASLGWQAELRLHVSYVYQTNVGHSWVKCYVWNLPQRNQGFYQLNMQALIDIYICAFHFRPILAVAGFKYVLLFIRYRMRIQLCLEHVWRLKRLAGSTYEPGKTTSCIDSCTFFLLVFFHKYYIYMYKYI